MDTASFISSCCPVDGIVVDPWGGEEGEGGRGELLVVGQQWWWWWETGSPISHSHLLPPLSLVHLRLRPGSSTSTSTSTCLVPSAFINRAPVVMFLPFPLPPNIHIHIHIRTYHQRDTKRVLSSDPPSKPYIYSHFIYIPRPSSGPASLNLRLYGQSTSQHLFLPSALLLHLLIPNHHPLHLPSYSCTC